ncbi:MAG: tannase/feruloyl esterase family alpha/beta hydrolase [Pseudomonadales bacterium]|nr:tannase/feruloyl esterase family alpha/beta hydrolase [Pseudomonadales bacterium]
MSEYLSVSLLSLLAVSLSVLLSALATPVLAQSPAACSALLGHTQDGVDLNITAAVHATDRQTPATPFAAGLTLPPHCHVEGEIDRRTGADGKSYALRFAINLPDNWNGRFLFQGGGGLNGSLNEPLGTQATGGRPALSRGFAVVSTDSGHQGQGGFDAGFMADQEAALNFFFLGNMRVTQVAKPLVAAYYSRPATKSYFVGCSTGGREGMIMAQRYPYLYDGIVSGAPAIRTGLSNLALRWMNVQMNLAAPKDAQGLPLPGGTYSKTEQALIIDGLLQSCDALDGAEDGLIFNTTACHFDPRSLSCPAGQQGANCLAADKADALAKAVAGPVDSRGLQVYSRFLLDTGIDDDSGFIPGIIAGGGVPPVGPPVATLLSQDVDAEFIAATATDAAIGDSTSYQLSSFAANGGKQLYYHGVSDPWFSAMDTVAYYQRMAVVNGGLESVKQWSRVFLVPGMGHCAGGEQTVDSFDMLDAIVAWVEDGRAPDRIIATGNSLPDVSRPLCPYPQHPHYRGSGDSKDAASFECRE